MGFDRGQTMQAGTTLPKSNHSLWAGIAGLLGLSLLALASLAVLRVSPLRAPATDETPSAGIAYFEFGATADTLWLADAANPSNRTRLLIAPHAAEHGVVASLSPDAQRLVYNALPPGLSRPAPDSPAGLWLKSTSGADRPVLIARDVDLLVEPVWSPDGARVVYRRSRPAYGLFMQDVTARREPLPGASERRLAQGEAALFPIAFSNDGAIRYYVQLGVESSDLDAVDVVTNEANVVTRLAEGLTRDGALSPDGTQLAYLEMKLEAGKITSQAFVADLLAGTRRAVSGDDEDAFSPVWTSDGSLILGSSRGNGGGLKRIGAEGVFKRPERGFDVPLMQAPGDRGVIVSSFDGASATSPGASSLTLLAPDGSRQRIASGDVAILGWVSR